MTGEDDLMRVLKEKCVITRIPKEREPDLIFDSRGWQDIKEYAIPMMTSGKIILVEPKEVYGHYLVK